MLASDGGLAGRLALDSFRQLAAVGCDEGTARQVTLWLHLDLEPIVTLLLLRTPQSILTHGHWPLLLCCHWQRASCQHFHVMHAVPIA